MLRLPTHHHMCSVRPPHASDPPSSPTPGSPPPPIPQLSLRRGEGCPRPRSPHLDDVSEVFPRNPVVRLDEDLSEDRLPNRVVFGIEFIEAMEGVPVLW